jgi:hypothetical protein
MSHDIACRITLSPLSAQSFQSLTDSRFHFVSMRQAPRIAASRADAPHGKFMKSPTSISSRIRQNP